MSLTPTPSNGRARILSWKADEPSTDELRRASDTLRDRVAHQHRVDVMTMLLTGGQDRDTPSEKDTNGDKPGPPSIEQLAAECAVLGVGPLAADFDATGWLEGIDRADIGNDDASEKSHRAVRVATFEC